MSYLFRHAQHVSYACLYKNSNRLGSRIWKRNGNPCPGEEQRKGGVSGLKMVGRVLHARILKRGM